MTEMRIKTTAAMSNPLTAQMMARKSDPIVNANAGISGPLPSLLSAA